MIPLPDRPLPKEAARRLNGYQQQIDQITDYAQRVAEAEAKFKARNKTTNATFRAVRETLTTMCKGAHRCCYCEDSAATQIDHHRPKTLYPELVFVWENYLYACSGCNTPKRDNYAIFAQQTGEMISVTRSAKSPIVPPETGDPVLIDPRRENPLELMRLDITGTFLFVPSGLETSQNYQRAKYTIDTLQLNKRSYLPQARRQAYQGYLSHLHRYLRWREEPSFRSRLNEPKEAIQFESHPTVWFEMKRQRQRIPELEKLFAEVPEALHW